MNRDPGRIAATALHCPPSERHFQNAERARLGPCCTLASQRERPLPSRRPERSPSMGFSAQDGIEPIPPTWYADSLQSPALPCLPRGRLRLEVRDIYYVIGDWVPSALVPAAAEVTFCFNCAWTVIMGTSGERPRGLAFSSIWWCVVASTELPRAA